MKSVLKKILNALIGPYEIYSIYEAGESGSPNLNLRSVGIDDIHKSEHSELRDLAQYDAPDAKFFGLFEGQSLVAVCCFWFGETYRKKRGFIELPEGSAKLVQVVTAQQKRGSGLASCLISGATHEMKKRGFWPLFARIWHNHKASERAFEKAGWFKCSTVIRFHLLGRQRTIRL